MKKNVLILTVVIFNLFLLNNFAFSQDTTKVDLYDMDLSALMEMTVTTASKKAQSIDEAPAAVTVITKEDLMFFGVDNLGEALRLVPGMEIIQGSDANYEISVRGFSRTGYNTSNKVLWLVDGRSAYYDGLGGFRMESCPIAIEDIERIEVVRGSGSALYGANAYSGIVNIITKKATEDGVHGAVTARYGNLNQLNTTANVIGKSNKLSYKATLGYSNIDQKNNRFEGLDSAYVDSLKGYGYMEGTKSLTTMMYGNMAVQYNLKENQSIRVAGGFSDSKADHFYLIPGEVKALDFFAQIDYNDEKNSFRAFYNSNPRYDYETNKFMYEHEASNPYLAALGRVEIDTFPGESQIITRTMDFEYQRNIKFSEKLSAIAGASYRGNFIKAGTFAIDGTLPFKKQNIFAAFTQIDYKPIEKLNISLGGRVDNHTTVGTNFNPKVVAVYKASDKHIMRAGWGTATRNPNSFDNYLNVYYQAIRFSDLGVGLDPVYNLGFSTPNIIFQVKGNTNLEPEKISSFELGYIFNVNEKLQLKVDAFYSETKNAIEFGSIDVTDAFDGSVSDLENISGIFKQVTGDPTFDFVATGNNIGATWSENMNKDEMEAAIAYVDGTVAAMIAGGYPPTHPDVIKLMTLSGGMQQISAIYYAEIPRKLDLPVVNSEKNYQSYGAEVGFTYIPVKGLTLTGNYSLLKFSDNYNEYDITGLDSLGNEDIEFDGILKVKKSSMHKANIGIKYKYKKIYAGVAFSFMSGLTQIADNNKNGMYDSHDVDLYDNAGLFTVDPRMNLNVNIGFQTEHLDIFISAFNLIQSDYQQFYYTSTIAGSDLLNTRIMGGIKVKF
jgi:iron complex outermembrane receptor protein